MAFRCNFRAYGDFRFPPNPGPLGGLSGSSCRDGRTADVESLELYAALAEVAPERAAEKLELARVSTRRPRSDLRLLHGAQAPAARGARGRPEGRPRGPY